MFLFLCLLVAILGSCNGDCFGEESGGINFGTYPDYQDLLINRNQIDFSINLFHKLYNKDEDTNLFFSPESIHKALLLTLFGSKGETESQLRNALFINQQTPKNQIIQQHKMDDFFAEASAANRTDYDLKIATKMFVSTEEPMRDCVLKILDKEIEKINFANETESSRKRINSWVYKNTNEKIKEILPKGILNSNTRMTIANSAYFKGNWEQRFKKSNTKMSLFYVSTKKVTPTFMMYQKGSFRHGISERLRAYILELPYEGEGVSMFILLPPFVPDGIQETIERLNASSLREALDENELYKDKIEVVLPRFKIQQTLQLSQALSSIGITDLFDETKANLSDFSSKEGLFVNTARHKSFLEVNEEGSEAAAATVLIDTRSGRPLDQTQFICNHPFIFLIQDNADKRILFMGAFRNPKLTEEKEY